MKKTDLRNVFESIGLVAIVLSLIFVGLQIRQDQVLARSELGAGSLETFIPISLTASDPDFAKTWAKMLNEPENLTDDEMIQINGYLQAAKALLVRECYLVNRGVFVECNDMVRAQLQNFFGSSYAQSWWRQNWYGNSHLEDWVNDEVKDLDADATRSDLQSIRDGI